MQSQLTSPLIRFDVVMAFLRVQLWLSVVALGSSAITAFSYRLMSPLLLLRIIGGSAMPVLLLLLFPTVLASNALGHTVRDPVAASSDLRVLVGRCAGLVLFLQSLDPVVFLSGMFVYALATRTLVPQTGGGLSSFHIGFQSSGTSMWMGVREIVAPIISLLLGFFLAFGPSLQGNFRGR